MSYKKYKHLGITKKFYNKLVENQGEFHELNGKFFTYDGFVDTVMELHKDKFKYNDHEYNDHESLINAIKQNGDDLDVAFTYSKEYAIADLYDMSVNEPLEFHKAFCTRLPTKEEILKIWN